VPKPRKPISEAQKACLAKARQARLDKAAKRLKDKELRAKKRLEADRALRAREKCMTKEVIYSKGADKEFMGSDEENQDVKELMSRFWYKGVVNYPVQIELVQVERLRNPCLEERYQAKKEEFEKKYGEREDSEMLMFHGTAAVNLRL
jgi:hypothetical protein